MRCIVQVQVPREALNGAVLRGIANIMDEAKELGHVSTGTCNLVYAADGLDDCEDDGIYFEMVVDW
jgi:hypothetical protein